MFKTEKKIANHLIKNQKTSHLTKSFVNAVGNREQPNFCKFLHGLYSLYSQNSSYITGNSDKPGLWGEILAILNLIEEVYMLECQQHLITECKSKIVKGYAVNLIAQILYKSRYILDTHLRG